MTVLASLLSAPGAGFGDIFSDALRATSPGGARVVQLLTPTISGAAAALGAAAAASALLPHPAIAQGAISLTQVVSGLNQPSGIDQLDLPNQLIVSHNYISGLPNNFVRVAPNGSTSQFSSASGFQNEIKISSVRRSACLSGGFNAGEIFTGNGTNGGIARLSRDESVVESAWLTLDDPGTLRGGVYHDFWGVFGGKLIVLTTAGNVWTVDSNKNATRLASIGVTDTEGVTTVPNSSAYGPWAGKIVIGSETNNLIYSIDTSGNVQSWSLGITQPEEVRVIVPNQNFFAVDTNSGAVWGAAASQFAGMLGDMLVSTQQGSLYRVHWNSANASFDPPTLLAQVPELEQMTFSSAGAGSVAPLRQQQCVIEQTSSGELIYEIRSPDPVSTLTGSYEYRHTDLAIAGRGPAPALARAYNSNDPRSGPLGPGWTHSYDIRLVSPAEDTQDLILVEANGRNDRFTYANGSYTAPPPLALTLVQTGNTFTVTQPDQSVWSFDLNGKLQSITDRYGNASVLTYNTMGQLISVTDPAGRGALTFAYSPSTGKLLSVTDWLSPARSVQFSYDSNNRLSVVTDRNGKPTTYCYDDPSTCSSPTPTHHISKITDANGHAAVSMTYDREGRVQYQWDAKGSNAPGQRTEFSYGTNTTTVTLPVTSNDSNWAPTITDTYDSQGRITQHAISPTSSETSTQVFAYDGIGNRSQITDANQHALNFCYDGARNLRLVVGPSALDAKLNQSYRTVTYFQYDADNNLTLTVPPEGIGNIGAPQDYCAVDLSTTAANSAFRTNLQYDNILKPQTVTVSGHFTNPDGGGLQTATTTYTYDVSNPSTGNPGRLLTVQTPRANTTTFSYYPPSDPSGQAGMLQSVTGPPVPENASGNKVSYTYDQVGRRNTMTDPLGNAGQGGDHTWTYDYDNEDRPTQVQAPAPTVGANKLSSQAQYDPVGNRVVASDANDQITRYQYDSRDSLSEVDQSATVLDPNNDPAKIATQYSYDNLGNLVRVFRDATDATASNQRVVDYAYDGLNRVRRETQYPQDGWPSTPNGSTTSQKLVTQATYDANGNRTQLVDPLNQTTAFAYDALNRLTGISYTNSAPGTTATANVTYAYDANGNRMSMADGTGTTGYTYDEMDRLLSATQPGAAGPVGYRYDGDGNRTKLIYSDGTAVNYTFDNADRMSALTDWATRTTSYSYFQDSRVAGQTNSNGTNASFTFDNARRLTQVWNQEGANTISQHTYTLDAVGNRTQVSEVLPRIGPPGPIGLSPDQSTLLAADPALEGFPFVSAVAPDELDLAATDQAAAAQPGPPGPLAGTSTPTPTPTPTPTSAATASASISPTPTSTATSVATSSTPTAIPTATAAATGSPVTAATATGRVMPAGSPTVTPTLTPTAMATPSSTPLATPTGTISLTPTATPTTTPSAVAGCPTGTPATGTRTPTAVTVASPTPCPSPTATLVTQPVALVAGLIPVPLVDNSSDAKEPYTFRAEPQGYAIELFSKADPTRADVRLTHTASGASLTYELRTAASARGAQGATGSALAAGITLQWTTYTDRLKETLTLAVRPPADQVVFTVQASGLRFVPDEAGGFWAEDRRGATLFRILAPAAQDAQGQPVGVMLRLNGGEARFELDRDAVAAASFPITIDPTTLLMEPIPQPAAGPQQPAPTKPMLRPGDRIAPNGHAARSTLDVDPTTGAPSPLEIPKRQSGSSPAAQDQPSTRADQIDTGAAGDDLLVPDADATQSIAAIGAAGPLASGTPLPTGDPMAWGDNFYGQSGNGTTTNRATPIQVSISGVNGIAAGRWHTVAVKTTGTVWAWGWNTVGEVGDGTTTERDAPVQVTGLSGTFTAVAAGGSHSLALKSDGTVWAWGWNAYGQLGNGTTNDSSTPVQVSGLSGVIAIKAGLYHSLAVTSAGYVYAWGDNTYGQLGDGTYTRRLAPVRSGNLHNVTAIATEGWTSYALNSSGNVYATGGNWDGEIGNGTSGGTRNTWTQTSISGVSAIAAGIYHGLAVKGSGSTATAWAWGYDYDGQLGDGTYGGGTCLCRTTPVQFGSITGVVSMAGGGYTTLARITDGTVYTSGSNTYGEIGDNDRDGRTSPYQIGSFSGVGGVAGGLSHSAAFKSTDNSAWTWGDDFFGQLGDNNPVRDATPSQVSGLTGATSVAGGLRHTAARKGDGTAWGWGWNYNGEVGDGTTTNRTTPTQASGITGAVAVATGAYHTLAVKTDGTVWAWGSNDEGELGNGNNTDQLTPVQVQGLTNVIAVAAGQDHSLALKLDGTVWAWGYNGSGQLGTGTNTSANTPQQVSGLNNVIAISAGMWHSLALKVDGTVWAWGNNSYGQLGNGTWTDSNTPTQASSISGVAAISSGGWHVLALKPDGTAWAWGYNGEGELGDNSINTRNTAAQVANVTGVVAIAGGGYHSLALKGDGSTWVWGWNGYGALGDSSHQDQHAPEQVLADLPGMTIVTGGFYHSLAAASSDVVSTTGSTSATAGNNAPRLLEDNYGKLLLVSGNAQGGLTASWSNDGGATWSASTVAAGPGYATPAWALGPDGTLHLTYKGPAGVAYEHLTILRDSNNNVTGVATAGSAVVLESGSAAQQPSLALDKVGYPAVAWISGSWSVHFLRATDDPTVSANWVNAQGTGSAPDVLGSQSGTNIQGSAVLLHMPPNASNPGPNDDGLYLFWTDSASNRLWWSKALISGSAYTAWTTPDNKAAAIGGTYGLSGAADATTTALVVAAETGASQWRIDRKQSANDADASDTALLAPGTWGEQLSLGIDRGDVYAVYKNAAGNIGYRKYLPEKGWDTAETVPDTSSANDYPSARADNSDGQVDVVWTRHPGSGAGDQPRHLRLKAARPAVNQLANTGIADPSTSTTANVTSNLNDDKSPTLTGSTTVLDSQGSTVRTLFSGSETRGSQSVVWDGKDNLGNPLTPGNYTVQANSTDTDDNVPGQATSSAQVSKRQSTTTYGYDKLYRLTQENAPEGLTTYTYDPVGNRSTRVRLGTTDTYSYDQADRLQSVASNDGRRTTTLTYLVNNAGNVVARGHDYFLYDQANRITKSAVRQPSKYAYNGDGLRVQSNVGTGPYTTHVWDVGAGLPLLLYDGNRKYVYGATGLAEAMDGNSQLEIYHTDGLGSVRAVTYANGTVVQTYGTDAFGIPAADLTQGTSNQPMQFTGEYSDKEDGFSYVRTRYYDPNLGRFLSQDPVRKSATGVGGWNRYSYVIDNPVRFRDRSGLTTERLDPDTTGFLQAASLGQPLPLCPPGEPCILTNTAQPPVVQPKPSGSAQLTINQCFLTYCPLHAWFSAAGYGELSGQVLVEVQLQIDWVNRTRYDPNTMQPIADVVYGYVPARDINPGGQWEWNGTELLEETGPGYVVADLNFSSNIPVLEWSTVPGVCER